MHFMPRLQLACLLTAWVGLGLSVPVPAGEKSRHGPLPAPVLDSDFYDDGAPDEAMVELGRLLFYDKSKNNIY
ncbi:MAG TPA: hypothetical protein VIS57_02495 [Xanthomonadales bacterium]